jgi:hypothetical protein
MLIFRDIELKVDAAKTLLGKSGFGKLTNPFAISYQDEMQPYSLISYIDRTLRQCHSRSRHKQYKPEGWVCCALDSGQPTPGGNFWGTRLLQAIKQIQGLGPNKAFA